MPWAVCSSSNQAPPRPRIARPLLTWSSVAASLAARPGLRNVLAPTSSPRRVRSVAMAHAVRSDPALEDRLVRVAEDGVQVVPGPQVVVAELVDALGRIEHLGPGGALAPEQDSELQICHADNYAPHAGNPAARAAPPPPPHPAPLPVTGREDVWAGGASIH